MRKLCLTRLLRAVTKPWQTLIEQEPERARDGGALLECQIISRCKHNKRFDAYEEKHTYTSCDAHTLSNARLHLEREGKLISTQEGKKREPPQTTRSEKQNKDQITVAQ